MTFYFLKIKRRATECRYMHNYSLPVCCLEIINIIIILLLLILIYIINIINIIILKNYYYLAGMAKWLICWPMIRSPGFESKLPPL